ncbi:hypothetical protein B0T20DRAFT_424385 [Sordaria brevicollis]|uniref:Uncharacterized protein n=1 Tax=Sordaria brevicollis TaxID=83679 RepID=A0AAE0P1J1_SORBR|nr:hypothetical protein B0T20DRAFT_424385 [Sordaria brevicollis]
MLMVSALLQAVRLWQLHYIPFDFCCALYLLFMIHQTAKSALLYPPTIWNQGFRTKKGLSSLASSSQIDKLRYLLPRHTEESELAIRAKLSARVVSSTHGSLYRILIHCRF